jgi:hypothetical protein
MRLCGKKNFAFFNHKGAKGAKFFLCDISLYGLNRLSVYFGTISLQMLSYVYEELIR